MNLIPDFASGADAISDMPFHLHVYLFLISNVETQDESLKSVYEVIDLVAKFKKRDEVDIDEALDKLKEAELITVRRGVITVGTYIERKKSLFTGVALSVDEDIENVEEILYNYSESTEGTVRQSKAKKLRSDFEGLVAKPFDRWTAYDYTNLFRIVYEAVFQDNCREMNGKEAGQMKNVMKLFDAVSVFKMVVYFVTHSDEFSKSYPTVGLFTYHKDNLYHKVRGKSKPGKNAILREGKKETGF